MNLNNKLWEIHLSRRRNILNLSPHDCGDQLLLPIYEVTYCFSMEYKVEQINKKNKPPESIVSLTQTLGTMENFGRLM